MGRLWKCDYSVLYNGNKIVEGIGMVLFIAVRALLWLSLVSGAATLIISGVGNDLLDMIYWGISFISFHPNTDLIENMSLLTRMHLMLLFTFFLVWSFTMFFRKSDKSKKSLIFKENKSQKLI